MLYKDGIELKRVFIACMQVVVVGAMTNRNLFKVVSVSWLLRANLPK